MFSLLRTPICVLLFGSVVACAGPATAAEGGLLKPVLGDVKGQVSDLINQAQAAGDFLIWRAASAVQESIRAFETSNRALLEDANSKINQQQDDFFRHAELTIKLMSSKTDAVYRQAQSITLQWSEIARRTETFDTSPDIFTYGPKFILPDGTSDVAVDISGPNLRPETARMVIKDWNGNVVTPKSATLGSITFDVSRATLKPLQNDIQRKWISVKFLASSWGWSSDRSRDLPVWILPVNLAHITVEPRVRFKRTEAAPANPSIRVGLKAGDETKDVEVTLPPILKVEGYKFDTFAILSQAGDATKYITGAGADGNGLCPTRIDPAKIFPDKVIISIYAGRSAGHGDATISCDARFPIIKETPDVAQGTAIDVDIGWRRDVRILLPKDLDNYIATVRMYNGTEFIVTDRDRPSPMGLLSFSRSGEYLIVHPSTPTE